MYIIILFRLVSFVMSYVRFKYLNYFFHMCNFLMTVINDISNNFFKKLLVLFIEFFLLRSLSPMWCELQKRGSGQMWGKNLTFVPKLPTPDRPEWYVLSLKSYHLQSTLCPIRYSQLQLMGHDVKPLLWQLVPSFIVDCTWWDIWCFVVQYCSDYISFV